MLGYLINKIKKQLKKTHSSYLQKWFYKHCKAIGKDCRFNGISTINGIENVEIGNNVHIGDNAFIRGEGGLYIGDNVHISRNFVLYTNHHNWNGELLPFDESFINKKVIIEKNVWIGMNVTIISGTHIKEGAIISAGCVVSGVIPALSIYGVIPQRIYTRKKEHYYNLDRYKLYGGVDGKPY